MYVCIYLLIYFWGVGRRQNSFFGYVKINAEKSICESIKTNYWVAADNASVMIQQGEIVTKGL